MRASSLLQENSAVGVSQRSLRWGTLRIPIFFVASWLEQSFVHVQVKSFVPGGRTVSVGRKSEEDLGPTFVWVLGGIPEKDSSDPFEYYVIPSAEVARNVRESHPLLLERKGKNWQEHRDSDVRAIVLPPGQSESGWRFDRFRNNWSVIGDLLKD